MSTYIATVIKTGNSYALRVPKKYVDAASLEAGEKVELPMPQKHKKQDRAKIQRAIQRLQAAVVTNPNGLASIKDPVAWQREIRKDPHPPAGRDY